MADRVLFVDDEQSILDGYQRLLRKEFNVSVAQGGELGLATIRGNGPFAVVISDMRMPGMNGADFLAKARELSPDSVRMLLTGYADLNEAIDAVNKGHIFRYLNKPCEKEMLEEAINSGLVQYHAVAAEKELIKRAKIIEQSASQLEASDLCPWDNFGSPTGLGGPSQAISHLIPHLAKDPQCYVLLLKLTVFETIEQRYGEDAAIDYLNITAHALMQDLRSEDRLFHWDRDVLMAVIRRQIPLAAVRMELERLRSSRREHLLDVKGKRVFIASPIAFDFVQASQFSSVKMMLTAFDASVTGCIKHESAHHRSSSTGNGLPR